MAPDNSVRSYTVICQSSESHETLKVPVDLHFLINLKINVLNDIEQKHL